MIKLKAKKKTIIKIMEDNIGGITLNIIYSCYWGGYLSVVAASLHIGILNSKDFTTERALELPMFGKIDNENLGKLYYIGQDKKGQKVYIIGSKNSGNIIKKAIEGIAHIFDTPKTSFINLNKYSNFYISLGLFLIKMNLKKQGLSLVVKGISRNLDQIEKLVRIIQGTNK